MRAGDQSREGREDIPPGGTSHVRGERVYREQGGEQHGGGRGVHLHDGVGVLHDPGHKKPAEGKVDGDGPRHPVPPVQPVGQPRPVLVAHLRERRAGT
eukprot:1181301-Prorocentrum_minimum.AAC.3